MTSHQECFIRPGWEDKTTRSPDDFDWDWKASQYRGHLLDVVEDYLQRHPFDGEHHQKLFASRRIDQFNLSMMLKMPMLFHLISSVTKSAAQALAPASMMLLFIAL
ncbi:ABC-2 type transporter [Colletotrichum orchidophilum]|uniref:ABC-2 type transporter n=1 Tax=Colletotrichum orchidophilum TaxID=1209926 RepID=A0A1G4BQX7_9PEZI|nr:ABC-2 type transporter [Colletotrichum orchidophilum]OHF03735.1 ABC-2 type transporter [Colletotrichum orchidophilum]